jgi:predicted Zn-ribbon and HTH transcriptional regulator
MKTSNLGGGPKFKMGKIMSKNLIVVVLSYVETYEEIINRFLFSNRSLRCLVIENLGLIQNQAKEMDEIKVTFNFNYHQDNTMVLIPDDCPKKYGFFVRSHNEIKNALQIAKARKSQINPKICFDSFIIDYRNWT